MEILIIFILAVYSLFASLYLIDARECWREYREILERMLITTGDHMTGCDRVMGDSHPCTCGADVARTLLERDGE